MLGRPSLRRRLILSYLAVVVAVTLAGFVTVQVLVPQFFEQGVQQRLGPGSSDSGNQQQGNPNAPENGQHNQATSTTGVPEDSGTGTTTTAPTTTTGPNPTGSTQGPGEPPDDPGNQGSGGGGAPGGNPDPGADEGQDGNQRGEGNAPGTTTEALGGLVPGVLASAELAPAQTEQNPVPTEIQEEYDRALTGALVVAMAIGLLIALVLGFWFTRRLLKTLNEVTDGARQLAEGRYKTRVPEPRETELADLAKSVNTLADSLDRTEQTRARLVSDLAHEIRNPLSTIEGYMEGLIDGVLPPSRETYEAVAGEAHRLKRLTRDLSTLSKAQEGAIEYTIENIDLADVASSVVDALRPQYELNQVDLKVTIEEPLPIKADSDRVAQALTNLVGNALAHTPPEGSVTLTGTATSRSCLLTIADTGSGIPQEQLETIFERFTRLDRGQPGTGIGLNIARTLVRAHGGDIQASSPGPGKGATFQLSLPRARG
jgi:signal transduction histidine kinase